MSRKKYVVTSGAMDELYGIYDVKDLEALKDYFTEYEDLDLDVEQFTFEELKDVITKID